MAQINDIDRGLAVLEARLQAPQAHNASPGDPGVRPFITLGRETGAGATTVGQLLVPLLDQWFGAEGQGWVFLDKNLLAHALARINLPERLAEHLPEDKISEITAVVGELMGLHPSLWDLEQRVAEAILQLAHVGRVIIAGRAAYLITQVVARRVPRQARGARWRCASSAMMKMLDCTAQAAAGAHPEDRPRAAALHEDPVRPRHRRRPAVRPRDQHRADDARHRGADHRPGHARPAAPPVAARTRPVPRHPRGGGGAGAGAEAGPRRPAVPCLAGGSGLQQVADTSARSSFSSFSVAREAGAAELVDGQVRDDGPRRAVAAQREGEEEARLDAVGAVGADRGAEAVACAAWAW